MFPKEKEKPKKERSHSQGWWQRKADDLMQDVGRKLTNNCMVCGGPNQVGHHYITKSLSSFLRYDFKNLIPLCHGCHFRHHKQNDPHIHSTVNRKKGDEWVDWIESIRRTPQKTGVFYYKEICQKMKDKLSEL